MFYRQHQPLCLYLAGFDTIIAGLQWSLFYLIKFPDIQQRIHQEIGAAFCVYMTNHCCEYIAIYTLFSCLEESARWLADRYVHCQQIITGSY